MLPTRPRPPGSSRFESAVPICSSPSGARQIAAAFIFLIRPANNAKLTNSSGSFGGQRALLPRRATSFMRAIDSCRFASPVPLADNPRKTSAADFLASGFSAVAAKSFAWAPSSQRLAPPSPQKRLEKGPRLRRGQVPRQTSPNHRLAVLDRRPPFQNSRPLQKPWSGCLANELPCRGRVINRLG